MTERADGAPRPFFSFGMAANGTIAVGIGAYGVVAIGVMAVGTVALGVNCVASSVAIGVNAVGPVAIGVNALGPFAIGWANAGGVVAVDKRTGTVASAHDWKRPGFFVGLVVGLVVLVTTGIVSRRKPAKRDASPFRRFDQLTDKMPASIALDRIELLSPEEARLTAGRETVDARVGAGPDLVFAKRTLVQRTARIVREQHHDVAAEDAATFRDAPRTRATYALLAIDPLPKRLVPFGLTHFVACVATSAVVALVASYVPSSPLSASAPATMSGDVHVTAGQPVTLDGGHFDRVFAEAGSHLTARDADFGELHLDAASVVTIDRSRLGTIWDTGGTLTVSSSTTGNVFLNEQASFVATEGTLAALTVEGKSNATLDRSRVTGDLVVGPNTKLVARASTFPGAHFFSAPADVSGDAALVAEEAGLVFADTWGRDACTDVLPCYAASGASDGVLQGHLSIAIGADGNAIDAIVYEGSAPAAVRACIEAHGRTRALPGFPGPPSHLTCSWHGDLHGGGFRNVNRYGETSTLSRDPSDRAR